MKLLSFFARRFTIVLLLGVIFVVSGVWVLLSASSEKAYTISKTSRGFIPSKIVIEKGDTVVFSSEVEGEFWPASDSHPTHGLYPGFDVGRPLKPEETWSMVFDAPGVWGFHDHMDSRFTGTIIVRGNSAEDRAECLKRQKSTDLAPACWESEITHTLSQKGLAAAFTLVDSFYEEDPAFRRNCHDVMHILGAASFREFKNSPSVSAERRTSYCGYGFYHGFIETMLLENGSSNFDAVKKYCTSLGKQYSPAASGPCFHGIGHALFDSLPGSSWGSHDVMSESALSVCEKVLLDTDERIQCASGVFNSLANALSARTYQLSFSSIDVPEFCESQKEEYRESCFAEIGIGYVRERNMNRDEALSFVRSIKDYEALSQLFYYFSDETKRMMHELNVGSLSGACGALQNSVEIRHCIDGVLQGFRESTQVEKAYEISLPFCGGFSDVSHNMYCVRNIIERTPESITSNAEFLKACVASSRPEVVSLCESL
ncbi:hypothetical protein K2P56_04980 [Patescibacteria group bacterium]|nr:hypothetical protein [Patescibacteria group bacterium]